VHELPNRPDGRTLRARGHAVTLSGRHAASVSPLEDVRRTLQAFVGWLDRSGPLSQDHMDLWAWEPGRRAKALYHRRPALGAAVAAPLAILDTFLPSTRRIVREPTRFPIADAHYAMAFIALESVSANGSHAEQARAHLQALERSRCPGWAEWCWGYPFAWETWAGTFEPGRPLITQTPYGYEAFAAAHERWGEASYREVMNSVAKFAMAHIPSAEIRPGVSACSYTPFDSRRVINANSYRAFLLVDAGFRFSRDCWMEEGLRNLAFVLATQQTDGSWLYAVDGRDAFVDNFHTCFVLKNLFKVWRITEREDQLAAIRRGYGYYKDRLLDDSGQPIPFSRKQRLTLFTRDLYDYAEGLNLALLLRDVDDDAESIADTLARALVTDWALPEGHFVTRQHRLGKNTVPYHRWAQAQTFHALVDFFVLRGRRIGPEIQPVLAS
jgi:hypothetical protein